MAPPLGVLGTGSYVPEQKVTNHELAARLDLTPDWIERKTRIRYRRRAAAVEAASDLALQASSAALEMAGLSGADLDYLILSTGTGDHPFPPTSYLLQDALAAAHAACLDINVGCAGFVYGLGLARGLAAARPGSRVLVVATEVYSRFLAGDDVALGVLLGDGAGAVVLGPVPEPDGILDIDLRSRGDLHQVLKVTAGGSRVPASAASLAAGQHALRMRGREVTDFVLGNVPGAVHQLLHRAGVPLGQVDHVIPHQANGRMLERLTEALGLEGARTHLTIEEYGNTASASVPITLDEANRAGAIRPGELVLLVAFGGGMALGNCLIRWTGTGIGTRTGPGTGTSSGTSDA